MALLLALGVVGCASVPPRPMPQAGNWARGATVYVEPPSGDWQESNKSVVRSLVEEDFRTAGMRVLPRAENKGELEVAISGLTWDGDNVTALVTLRRDGEELQRFSLPLNALPCFSLIRNTTVGTSQTTISCTSREVAARVIESQAVASAMARPARVAAVRKPAAGAMSGRLAVLDLRNFTRDLTFRVDFRACPSPSSAGRSP